MEPESPKRGKLWKIYFVVLSLLFVIGSFEKSGNLPQWLTIPLGLTIGVLTGTVLYSWIWVKRIAWLAKIRWLIKTQAVLTLIGVPIQLISSILLLANNYVIEAITLFLTGTVIGVPMAYVFWKISWRSTLLYPRAMMDTQQV